MNNYQLSKTNDSAATHPVNGFAIAYGEGDRYLQDLRYNYKIPNLG
ncbi:MAG: hypothetical protein AAFW70_30725 [Cyanobacteria bacterium J06635_10]